MVNPTVEFFGGIGLGALVGPGGNLLWGTVGKGFNFETWRTNLDSMINSLLPLIKEMEDQNKTLVIGDEEIEDLKQKLTEGEDLVEELKKVSSWSLMTPLHTNRLAELDKSIKRLLEILKVQGIRDVKGISLLAKDHTKQLKACKTDVEGTLVLAKDHTEQLKACKRDVEETLVLARDHSDQLTDCKSHVEDTLGLARKIDAKLDKFERIGLVQGEEVASLVERNALRKAVKELTPAVDKTLMNPRSFSYEYWERIRPYLRSLRHWFDGEQRAAEEKGWDRISFEELKKLTIQIEQGVKLARKCSDVDVSEWSPGKKSRYAATILDLEKSLQALVLRFKILPNVPVQTDRPHPQGT
ncbi:unnamed protein product [Prunus armeniaca]|uniref:RPW8 domain-containing protein n=1 Tax=Prunus armeniaca TaxID=36596 RepID=A0A6J5Y067_PRUAR|nr:unnamed protein product [Prunus armeniaca]